MSTPTISGYYSIREAAALTGLPASTLRYYESIGVIAPVGRGATSGHRMYDEADLDRIVSVACLAATGMSVSDMRNYVARGPHGAEAAQEQIGLLREQQERIEAEAELLVLRRRYVALKIDYWHAVEAGDTDLVDRLTRESKVLAAELTTRKLH